MSVASGPYIATNGLVLAYDMGNPERSWEGAPATNLVPNPYANWNGSNFVFGGYNYDATGTQTYTYVTDVSNPIGSPAVMQYTTGTTGYKYWAVQGTVATTGTHTFSYYARIVSGSAATSNLSNSQLWRSNGVDQAVTGDWNPTYTTNWVRYSTSGPCTAGTVLDYFPIHSGGLTGVYTIQYCGFQLELGTYATPFVNGTRSNTQALLDLTGQNTLTATSLTYAPTNTFSFNGSSNYVDGGNSTALQLSSTLTLESWVNPTSSTGLGNIISKNENSGYRYRIQNGELWAYSNGNGATSSTPLCTNGSWWHCVATFGPTGIYLYVNGNLVGSSGSAYSPANATASNLLIGCYGVNTEVFNGQISVAKVYNRVLSAQEVQQNFNALRGRYGV